MKQIKIRELNLFKEPHQRANICVINKIDSIEIEGEGSSDDKDLLWDN